LVYSKTLTDPSSGWEGFSLVQRIEADNLSATGPHVRITVQAASGSSASIDRVYISQADASGRAYDSAADLTAVYDLAANQQQPFLVPAGTFKSLPIVAYTINKFQALIIAIDFTASSPSAIEFASSDPASGASAYYLGPAGEAAVRNRAPNYAQSSAVFFVTKIEAG
jgi:hypothetical protein